MEYDDATPALFGDVHELLDRMEAALKRARRHPGDPDPIRRLWQTTHTLQWLAGRARLDNITAIAREACRLLDEVRLGGVPLNGSLRQVLLSLVEHGRDLAWRLEKGLPMDERCVQQGLTLMLALVSPCNEGVPEAQVGA